MKYFTPQLYIEFNSQDDDIADGAAELWESAIREYKHHLKEDVLEYATPGTKWLAEAACFHDAELVEQKTLLLKFPLFVDAFIGKYQYSKINEYYASLPVTAPIIVVNLRNESRILSLVYLVSGPVSRTPYEGEWPFSAQRVHWLYDEVGRETEFPYSFFHEILWSDGSTFRIPFYDVNCTEIAAEGELQSSGLGQQLG